LVDWYGDSQNLLRLLRNRKAKLLILLCLIVLSVVAVAMHMRATRKNFRSIEVDCANRVGVIRSLQGVNNGPLSEDRKVDLSDYYLDAGFTYIRLHDLRPQAGAVDIHCVFPDFDADPLIPENYDFAETDKHLQAMMSIRAEIIYRLGYSWEDHPVHNVPPRDYQKWAAVCVQIIKHYNDGWANGQRYNIRYWEIWNEPDITQFWTGTAEDYCRLYEITANEIKGYDPNLKVGGPTLAWNITFLDQFLKYCKTRQIPIDFVSWHVYSQEPYDVYLRAKQVHDCMEANGFSTAESLLTEWNFWPSNDFERDFRSVRVAAFDASAMIYLQENPPDIATFYRGDTWSWGGLFDQSGVPHKAYYSFKAFKVLLETPNRVLCTGTDRKGFATIAGVSHDNKTVMILISNYDSEFNGYRLEVKNLPWEAGRSRCELYVIDSKNNLDLVKSETYYATSLEIEQGMESQAIHLVRLIGE